MNKTPPWIASFVQECLSFYLDEGASKAIDVGDDGTDLSFKVDGSFAKANVLTWGIGSSDDGAVLMDSDYRIDASISKDAIAAAQFGSSNPASIGKSSEKHEVELLEFRLVLPYTTFTADVRLEVDSFRIAWEKGPQKFTPSKKLKKNKHVKSLLERALQKAKGRHRAVKSNGARVSLPKSPSADIAHGCNPIPLQSSPLSGGASQQFFSQVPINDSARLDRTLKSGNNLHARAELLERLAPSNRAVSRGLPSSQAQMHAKISETEGSAQTTINGDQSTNGLSRSTPPVAVKHGSYQQRNSTVVMQDVDKSFRIDTPTSRAGSASSLQSQNGQADNSVHFHANPETLSSQKVLAEHENAISRECHASPETAEPNDKATPSRKRPRESIEYQPRLPGYSSKHESTEPSPAKKKPRTEVSQGTSTETAAMENTKEKSQPSHSECQTLNADSGPKEGAQPMRSDPWEGLERIPASEVDIPTDQAEYLNDRTIWISPALGASHPQGHVPPPLLQQWNGIAERRHQLAEQARALAEQPISPTQDTFMSSAPGNNSDDVTDSESELSWEPSPERQPRNVLPPSSSPSEQPSLARKEASPDGSENESRNVEGGISLEESNCIPEMSGPGRTTEQTARHGSDGSASKSVLSPEVPAAEAAGPMLQSRSSVDARGRPEVDMDMQGESAATGSQAASPDQGPAEASALTSQDGLTFETKINDDDNDNKNHNDSGDESDESMMDTSVPIGLGESLPEHTQSTQAEQEMASSGPSLPAGVDGHVQVAVTPVTENSRLRRNRSNDEPSDLRPSHSAMSSSQANKLSSQSRIMNTYPNHGSYEKSQSSHGGVNSSSLLSPDGSLRVDVAGTQTQKSSLNELSQGATQSQEIVLDSSGPVQRHEDISLLGPQSANEPPTSQLASPRGPAQSQQNESTQDCMKENLLQDESASSPPTRHSNAAVIEQRQSYRQSTSLPDDEDQNSSQAPLNPQSAYLMTRRVGHISDGDSFAEAKEIYKRFRDDYPVYTGDFDHFTELCSKLQSVRAQGQLQRSFMWDDFIIMHILKYQSHIEERASQGSGTLSYEDYFCLNFTHPLHKKRSLTTRGIERAASQIVQAGRAAPIANSQVQGDPPFTQSENANQSFTTSLVDGFSNFHAHSFNEVPQSSLPDAAGSDAAEPDAASISQSSSIQIKEEGSDVDFEEMQNTPPCSMDTDNQKKEKSAISTLESNMDQNTHLPPYTANTHDDGDTSMDEIDETDLEDIRHETASVELGDDSFISTATPSHTAAVPEGQSQSESENENWFVSLRRMRPTGPVWSDDPNTPFKRWAEADLNVRSERLQRGGSRILLNEKGVIRRGIYR